MTVAKEYTKYVKSQYQTNTGINGGRASHSLVVIGARNNVLPRVTKSERIAGIPARDRKIFFRNLDPADEAMYSVKGYFETPSNGGDRLYMGLGTQTNQQSDWETNPPIFTGCGVLNTPLTGGESSVAILMEADDFAFGPEMRVHVSNAVSLTQTIAASVNIGDSIQESAGTWSKISATDDIFYPKGHYLGDSKVLTYRETTQEEWLTSLSGLNENEIIGSGDGAAATIVLTDLSDATRGVVGHADYAPVVKATCGGVERTVTIAADGTCSGYCSAGELNMATGVWVTDITWTTAPDNGSNLTVTYYHKNYAYAGNVVTVYLAETVNSAYSTDGSCHVGGCVGPLDIEATVGTWTETFAGTGVYDETTYPLVLYHDGTEYDVWTLSFTSASAFTLSGVNAGSGVATGSVVSDLMPTNPETGQPFFKLNKNGWSGSPQSGDTIVFVTYPAAFPMIIREVVPPNTAAIQTNITPIGNYWE